MTKTMTRLLAAATLCILPATAQAAVTYKVQNGKLTGAGGVMIGDKSYDVSFVDGTCASVYGTCATTSFDFEDADAAYAAAKALMAQVFVNGDAGKFDSSPALTSGCSQAQNCDAMIAHGNDGNFVYFWTAWNRNIESVDAIISGSRGVNFDSSTSTGTTFARFTPTAAVPEPATWALMLAGFGLTATALRRRRVRFAGAAA